MKKNISENQQIKNRKEKLNNLIEEGFKFPNNLKPRYKIIEINKKYAEKKQKI